MCAFKKNNGVERPYEKATIKVLMLGASRVGKTSILANMTSLDTLATVAAGTKLKVTCTPSPQIASAYNTMQDYFDFTTCVPGHPDQKKEINRDMMLCESPNRAPEETIMDFATVDSKTTGYTIGLKDIPGELVDKFGNAGNAGLTELEKNNLTAWVSEADVILVTVDSVLMLEEDGNNAVEGNRINEVCKLLMEYCDPKNVVNTYKMILFVPVKCEKYYHEHIKEIERNKGFDPTSPDWMLELNSSIRDKYRAAFDHFAKSTDVFQVAITPVLTLGNLKFNNFNISTDGSRTAKNMMFCYHYNDIQDISNNVLPKFEPQFCEQPLIYIMYFELLKIRKLNESRGFFAKLFNKLRVFTSGLAKDEDMLAEMENLKRNIRRNVAENGWYTAELVQDPMHMSLR